jgi:hypothetical protein
MELSRWVGLAVAVAVLAAAGCGRKPHAARHDALAATPEPAPPTPDTTPIAALRTPAGLALAIEGPPTPAPASAPTPPLTR